jgi:hypothetical protein
MNTETWTIWCYACSREIYVDSHKKLYEVPVVMSKTSVPDPGHFGVDPDPRIHASD